MLFPECCGLKVVPFPKFVFRFSPHVADGRNGVLRAVKKWFSASRLLWRQSLSPYSSGKEHSSRMPSWKRQATSSRHATWRCLILNFLAFMFWEINVSCTYTTQCQVLCNCSTNKTNTLLVSFPLLGNHSQPFVKGRVSFGSQLLVESIVEGKCRSLRQLIILSLQSENRGRLLQS